MGPRREKKTEPSIDDKMNKTRTENWLKDCVRREFVVGPN